MPNVKLREFLGQGLRPVLCSERLDHVRYWAPVRRFARDWAVAFGFWDDGVLEKEQSLAPIDLRASAARTRDRKQASLTLYVDKGDVVTARIRTFLHELEARPREVDIGADAASRKWLADEHQGARPPQLFIEGERVGGLEELRRLHEGGLLLPRIFPNTSR